MHVSKDVVDNFLVHSSTKDCLKRAKNIVLFVILILVVAPSPPGYATALHPDGFCNCLS